MRFELLKEEDVKGENCLSIFKKISSVALATDLVKSEFKNIAQGYPYWLDSYRLHRTEKVPSWQIGTDPNIEAKYMDVDGSVRSSELNIDHIGVRLKVSYDDIKDQIIRDTLSGMPYVVEAENEVKVLLALEWPQEFVTERQEKENLDILQKYGKLEKAEKEFDVSTNKKIPTVQYKKDMYVRVGDNWAKITPIEWYYDEESNVLVSKKIFLCCPMAAFSGRYRKNFDYEKSIIASFICNKFKKEAIIDSPDSFLFPIPFYDAKYDYTDELKEIAFWNSYNEKRKKRKNDLEEIKTMLPTDRRNEFSQIIDDILGMNNEDERFVKQFVTPQYIVDRN